MKIRRSPPVKKDCPVLVGKPNSEPLRGYCTYCHQIHLGFVERTPGYRKPTLYIFKEIPA